MQLFMVDFLKIFYSYTSIYPELQIESCHLHVVSLEKVMYTWFEKFLVIKCDVLNV